MSLRVLLLLIFCGCLIWSCDERDDPATTCAVKDPVEDLDWLGAQVGSMRTSGMTQYLWVSKAQHGSATVFIFGNCCPNCLSVWPVYNCSGELLGDIGSDIDPKILHNDIIIWKGENSVCNLD